MTTIESLPVHRPDGTTVTLGYVIARLGVHVTSVGDCGVGSDLAASPESLLALLATLLADANVEHVTIDIDKRLAHLL